MVEPGTQSLSQPPTGSESFILISFSVDSAGNYSVFACLNCPTYDDDSYWVKMDNGNFQMYNGLVTSGWEWKKLNEYTLTYGKHTLTIAYREDGARLDKICISNYPYPPLGKGEEALNLCSPLSMINSMEVPFGYTLEQNYPNPFNPITSIKYHLFQKSRVTLEVLDITGRTVEVLINRIQPAGEHTITFDGSGLASGIYFYRLKTSAGFVQMQKMLLVR